MLEAVIFYVFAISAMLAGITVVTRSSPITAAIALVACFFFLSGMYAMLDAHFVAVIQILVYAGAIMVLFVFVIMLLNLRDEGPSFFDELAGRGVVGIIAAAFIGIGVFTALEAVSGQGFAAVTEHTGTIEAVGQKLFDGSYLLPFEVASALLTIAMIGAVVLAKREI